MIEKHRQSMVYIECLDEKDKRLDVPITYIGTPLLKQLITSSCSRDTDVNSVVSKVNHIILNHVQTYQLPWRLDKDEITFVPSRNHYDELLQIRIGKGTVGHEFIDWHFSSHCGVGTINFIGRFTQITGKISIMTNSKCRQRPAQYDFNRLWRTDSTPTLPNDYDLSKPTNGSVVIGNDVWIGPDVVIISGVTIGDGAVLEAGAVITTDVPPYAIVIGNPARVVNYRFDETVVKQMLDIQWWTWSSRQILHAVESRLLDGDDMSLFLKVFGQPLPASVLAQGVAGTKCGDERKKVCFHINHAGERGVEISTYDYADFLEVYYGDRFTSVFVLPRIKAVTEGISFPKFQKRFPIVLYDVEHERPGGKNLTMAIRSTNCDVLYMQKGVPPRGNPCIPTHSLVMYRPSCTLCLLRGNRMERSMLASGRHSQQVAVEGLWYPTWYVLSTPLYKHQCQCPQTTRSCAIVWAPATVPSCCVASVEKQSSTLTSSIPLSSNWRRCTPATNFN